MVMLKKSLFSIHSFQVVLCFLTPRYVLSPLCSREMSLADILRKPIVPIMLEPTPWPPPGALALILSSLVYIDLCGKWNLLYSSWQGISILQNYWILKTTELPETRDTYTFLKNLIKKIVIITIIRFLDLWLNKAFS